MRSNCSCDAECMCSRNRIEKRMNCEGDCGECRVSCDWATATAEEYADAIEAICVEKDGKCQIDPCQCKKQEPKERDVW